MSESIKRSVLMIALVAAGTVGLSRLSAQSFTLENASITFGAAVLPDNSIVVLGQQAVGTVSNADYTLETGHVPCLLAALKGDFDEDFDIDFVDLSTFVDVLIGTDTAATHLLEADINGDGAADGKDIDPFVKAMLTL